MVGMDGGDGYYGYVGMRVGLGKEGVRVKEKKVYGLMKELGMSCVIRKKGGLFGKEGCVVNGNGVEGELERDRGCSKVVREMRYIGGGEEFV
ncbi:IS3 family transposase [Paenibacillus xylanexedens]|uniref:IS3 family transposase n=1 Tax=Paenibacillus xylanexedens TaxID=528191 RepID=UPI0011AA308A|nr:IS3 family transposase [Paenibacillus xylanexedens]